MISTLQVFLQTTLQSLSCLGSLHPLILLPPPPEIKHRWHRLWGRWSISHLGQWFFQPSPEKKNLHWRVQSGKGRAAGLAALQHFLFCTQIGISAFGSSSSHLFLSVLLWYQMLICCFSIKIWLHLRAYHGAARSSERFGHAQCAENPDLVGKGKGKSWDCLCGTSRDGIVPQVPHTSCSTGQPSTAGIPSRRKALLRGKKQNNNAPRIIVLPHKNRVQVMDFPFVFRKYTSHLF